MLVALSVPVAGVDCEELLDRLAAAICHAGIEAERPSCERGLLAAGAGAGVALELDGGAAAGAGAGDSFSTDAGAPFVTGVSGWGDPTGLPAGGVLAALPPNRLPRRTFKLFSSLPSSFNRFSLPSRAPSRALGIASFRDFTSSLIRRVSSSLRRDEFFNSATTLSTSFRAESRRSVRASSASFNAVVSVESCSISANARENCSSIFSLSCSS